MLGSWGSLGDLGPFGKVVTSLNDVTAATHTINVDRDFLLFTSSC